MSGLRRAFVPVMDACGVGAPQAPPLAVPEEMLALRAAGERTGCV